MRVCPVTGPADRAYEKHRESQDSSHGETVLAHLSMVRRSTIGRAALTGALWASPIVRMRGQLTRAADTGALGTDRTEGTTVGGFALGGGGGSTASTGQAASETDSSASWCESGRRRRRTLCRAGSRSIS